MCCYFFSCPNLTLHSTLQLRSRRRRLRNLHTDPSLPPFFLRSLLSFSSVGTVFTILHASLPPFLQSPRSAAKYANPAGKGPSYMEPSRPSVPPLRRAGRRPFDRFFGAANWNSFSPSAVLEPSSSLPPSLPSGSLFSVPVRSLVPRLPFLRPMQPSVQQVWVGSPLSLPPRLSLSPRDMQSGWIYPLKSERPLAPSLPSQSSSIGRSPPRAGRAAASALHRFLTDPRASETGREGTAS